MGKIHTTTKPGSRITAAVKGRAAAFIPGHISNRVTVAFLGLLSFCHRILGRKDYGHRALNEEAIRLNHLSEIQKNHGYIEDQFRYRDVKLGSVDMAYAGCEIIALYNALQAYHSRFEESENSHAAGWSGNPAQDLARLISLFEMNGILLSGRFGTSPRALCSYLNQLGIRASLAVLNGKKDCLPDPETMASGDCFILTFYNNRHNIMDQVHTICISKRTDGQFLGHNLRRDVAGTPYQDIRKMLEDAQEGHAKGITLITIHF